MNSDSFDDEVLSAVLDGMADEETVASVMSDPAARARLEDLREVTRLLAQPPEPATSERRSASISAALAQAQAAPGVTSLAAARHTRFERLRRISPQWIAAAAAAVLLLVLIPFAFRGGDNVETATTDTSSRSFAADEASDDATESAELDAATADDADATLADDGADSAGEEAMAAADSDGAGDSAETTTTIASLEPTTRAAVVSTDELRDRIDSGFIVAQYSADDPLLRQQLPEPSCLEQFAEASGPAYEVIDVVPDGAEATIVLVHFGDDGTITLLDAEDCSPVG